MKFSPPLGNKKYNTPDDDINASVPSLFWQRVWSRKACNLKNECSSVIDGYHFITEPQYHELIRQVIIPMNLKPGNTLLECGCGSGAFLHAVKLASPGLHLFGVDYSEPMLEVARARMPEVRFFSGDIRNLSGMEDECFDHTAAFAVLCYLNNVEEACQALDEMVRVTRAGGFIFLGDTSDAGKRVEAMQLLRKIWQPLAIPDYLFLEKDFFRRYAAARKLAIRIIDMDQPSLHWYPPRSLRYGVYLYKPRRS
jgi:ubiquinone/menaquinone biosynthesis C-methylase UbiE